MNPKNNADLQRRLSMAPVPTPPAGLAERIKREIPADLTTTARPAPRVLRNAGLRVAASILLLAGSAWIGVRLLWRSGLEQQTAPVMVERVREPGLPARVPVTTVGNGPAKEISLPAPPAQALERSIVEPREERAAAPWAKDEAKAAVQREAPAIADFAPPAPEPSARRQMAATSAGRGNVGEAITVQPAATALGGVTADAVASTARESGTAKAATAQSFKVMNAPLQAKSPSEIFGVSATSDEFMRVKRAIEGGTRPRNIDGAAIVSYFASGALATAGEMQLEAEVSPAASGRSVNAAMLRISVDAPRREGGARTTIARDARLDVGLSRATVADHHRVGGGGLTADSVSSFTLDAPAIHGNDSVTLLYRLELRVPLPSRAEIATVRLTWRDSESGAQKTLATTVTAGGITKPWRAASRRQRLATLGEAWGATLQSQAEAEDVARRAEELAAQEPADTRARDLFDLATASSRLQNSGPTGSGR